MPLANKRVFRFAQGLGEGPAAVMAGTRNGYICLCDNGNQHLANWSAGDPPYRAGGVDCIAATDRFVIAAYGDGKFRVLRMDTWY
jgi:hypothetical protein